MAFGALCVNVTSVASHRPSFLLTNYKMATLTINLKRASKIYKEGETIKGSVIINSKNEISHNGLTLTMDGSVKLQLSARSVGRFEAFYNSLKPIQLVHKQLVLVNAGKLPSGITELAFELPLLPKQNKSLYETYHGVFVNVQYMLSAEMKRSFLNKDLQKELEFIVEYKQQDKKAEGNPIEINISPSSVDNVKDRKGIPNFLVRGRLDSDKCCITKPFTGEIVVEHADAVIKSLEIQLVRVETCGCAEGFSKDATEIQNIQIGEGDICRGLAIPVYMIFPRLFTCPTLRTNNFKVDFEINVIVIFHDNRLVQENFPIFITRF